MASVLGRFGSGDLKQIHRSGGDTGGFDDMYVGEPNKVMTQFYQGDAGTGRLRPDRAPVVRRRHRLAGGHRLTAVY